MSTASSMIAPTHPFLCVIIVYAASYISSYCTLSSRPLSVISDASRFLGHSCKQQQEDEVDVEAMISRHNTRKRAEAEAALPSFARATTASRAHKKKIAAQTHKAAEQPAAPAAPAAASASAGGVVGANKRKTGTVASRTKRPKCGRRGSGGGRTTRRASRCTRTFCR